MFKNSLKIVMLAGILSLSTSAAICSFSSHINTATCHTLLPQKADWIRHLQFCRTNLRPDLLVRKHPIITLCVGLGICGGIYACYSGLLSGEHGKNVEGKNTALSSYKKGFNTMKHWLYLAAISLGFASQETHPAEQKKEIKPTIVTETKTDQIFNDFAKGMDKVNTQPTEQIEQVNTQPTKQIEQVNTQPTKQEVKTNQIIKEEETEISFVKIEKPKTKEQEFLDKKQELGTKIETALLDDNAAEVKKLLENNTWFDPFTKYQQAHLLAVPGETLFEMALKKRKPAVLKYLLSAYAEKNSLQKLFPKISFDDSQILAINLYGYNEKLNNLIYPYFPKDPQSIEQQAWNLYQKRLNYDKKVARLYAIAAQNKSNPEDVEFFSKNLDKDILSKALSQLLLFNIHPYQETLFYCAVRNKNIEIAKILLRTQIDNVRVDPNQAVAVDDKGWTLPLPLHWAIKNNDLTMLNLLITHGANPDLKEVLTYSGDIAVIQSPREFAITLYNEDPFPKPEELKSKIIKPEEIEEKIEKIEKPKVIPTVLTEEPTKKDEEILSWGQKLYWAMGNTSKADEFKSLWNEKINDNLTKEQFKTIDQQFRKELNSSSAMFHYNISLLCAAAEFLGLTYVTQLLKLGADAGEVITEGNNYINRTPLYAATAYAAPDGLKVAQMLLENGAAPTINKKISWDPSGKRNLTALHNAVYGDKFKLVKLLVENGARLDLEDENGDTPLHYAAISLYDDNNDICRYLLENGADGNALNKEGKAPWQLASAGYYQSFDSWLENLYPNTQKREKAKQINKKAMEKLKN